MINYARLCAVMLVGVSLCCAKESSTTSSRFSQEPGAAETKVTGKIPRLPKTWTHPAVEARGIWIPRDSMEAKKDANGHVETNAEVKARLSKTLDQLKAANFNLLLVDCWFKGYVAYPGSHVAPQYPAFKGDDRFGFMVSEAHKRGMQIHAWLGYGFYAYYTSDASKDPSKGALLDARPELAAVDSTGKQVLHRDLGDYYSLCPSNPKSHELLGEILVEVATAYPVDGVHLDRIRYPEENFCYCDYCKEHFKKDTGLELKEYSKGSAEAKKFLDWRREQTAVAVAHFKKVVQSARPELPMTAYVLSPADMDSKAQGWDLWIQRGLLDAVAVSMYGTDIEPSAKQALKLLGGRKTKLMCAISSERPTKIYLANINVARGFTPTGQCTWWLDSTLDDLDGLKAGPYSEAAADPFGVKK